MLLRGHTHTHSHLIGLLKVLIAVIKDNKENDQLFYKEVFII